MHIRAAHTHARFALPGCRRQYNALNDWLERDERRQFEAAADRAFRAANESFTSSAGDLRQVIVDLTLETDAMARSSPRRRGSGNPEAKHRRAHRHAPRHTHHNAHRRAQSLDESQLLGTLQRPQPASWLPSQSPGTVVSPVSEAHESPPTLHPARGVLPHSRRSHDMDAAEEDGFVVVDGGKQETLPRRPGSPRQARPGSPRQARRPSQPQPQMTRLSVPGSPPLRPRSRSTSPAHIGPSAVLTPTGMSTPAGSSPLGGGSLAAGESPGGEVDHTPQPQPHGEADPRPALVFIPLPVMPAAESSIQVYGLDVQLSSVDADEIKEFFSNDAPSLPPPQLSLQVCGMSRMHIVACLCAHVHN